MNYKINVIIALALVLACVIPASAVWSNDKWVDGEHSDEYFGTAKVVTDPRTGVTSKYNPVTSETDLMTYAGHVYGNLKSGHVLEGGERFLVSNDLTPNVTQEYKFNSDGLFDDYFAAGDYTITLPQGTGSAAGIYTEDAKWIGNLHPEVAHINVKAGHTTYFTFIGNSVPTASSDCVPKYTIVDASYCGETESHVVHHDAIPSVAAYYTVAPASPHQECYWWGGYYHCDTVYDGDCAYAWGQTPDFYIGYIGYVFKPNGPFTYTFHKAVPAVPAWDETVIDHKGGCAHPVTELQSVVDRGFTSFLFDNRPAEGGIFSADGSTLLKQIDDPASGIQKHVSITYNAGCGTGDKTVEANEYEVINL